MSLPLVTRFGADPLLDLEVANKQYVDNSGGGSAKDVWTMLFTGTQSSNSVLFWGINGVNIDATENDVETVLSYQVTQTRMISNVYQNTKNGDVILSLRDDGSSINPLTVGAGITGVLDSGAVSTDIALNSTVNFIRDATGSSSGSIGFNMLAEVELDT